MDIYGLVVTAPRQMLASLGAQLDKAVAWGAETGVSADDLLARRLAPDMFPLAMQVKFVCIQARETVWRLRGEEIAAWECGDSLDELKDVMSRTMAFLDAVGTEDFAGAEARTITLALPNGIVFELSGADFVRDWAIPQFHFHAITAYAILRNAGVPLGKADFVPHMLPHMRQPG